MRTLLLVLTLSATAAAASAQSAADGAWNFVLNSPMGTVTAKVDIETKGEALTGTFNVNGASWPIEHGTLKGDTLTFDLQRPGASMTYEMSGTLSGDSIAGKAAAMGTTVDWSMSRVK